MRRRCAADLGAEMEPDHPFVRSFRAVVLYHRGDVRGAAGLMREVIRQHPDVTGLRAHLAQMLAILGEHDEARAILADERLHEVALADHDVPYWPPTCYALKALTRGVRMAGARRLARTRTCRGSSATPRGRGCAKTRASSI